MDQPTRLPRLQPDAKAIWRKAADELLIDAIFGAAPLVRRDVALRRMPVVGPPSAPHLRA